MKNQEDDNNHDQRIADEVNKNSPPVLGGVDAFRGRGGNSVLGEVPERRGGKQLNNLPHLKAFRKQLRNNLTPSEAAFWNVVKNSKFEGRKFRRQHSVGNYILDFYCPSEKLAVELDGQIHLSDAARNHDRERRLFLESCGIRVIRFENRLVFEDIEWILGVITSNFDWRNK